MHRRSRLGDGNKNNALFGAKHFAQISRPKQCVMRVNLEANDDFTFEVVLLWSGS